MTRAAVYLGVFFAAVLFMCWPLPVLASLTSFNIDFTLNETNANQLPTNYSGSVSGSLEVFQGPSSNLNTQYMIGVGGTGQQVYTGVYSFQTDQAISLACGGNYMVWYSGNQMFYATDSTGSNWNYNGTINQLGTLSSGGLAASGPLLTGYNGGLISVGSWKVSISPVSSVPIPGTVYLLGFGLAGLAAFRRKLRA